MADDNLLPHLHHGSPDFPIWWRQYPPVGMILTIQWEKLVKDIDAHGNIVQRFIKIHS